MAKLSTARQRIPDSARRAQLQAAARRHDRVRLYRLLAIPTALAVAGIATAVTLSLTHHSGPTPPRPVSTVAENKRACLLSDPAQAQAPTVLTGMQQAATRSGNVNVQQITLPAGTTDAAPELAGLIQQHCDAIVVVGPLSTLALQAAAENRTAGNTTFIEITAATPSESGIMTLSPVKLTAAAVAQALESALK